MYAISGSKIFTPDNVLENYSVLIEKDHIINLSPCDKSDASGSHRMIDVGDMFIVPGFIDLQINGAFGVDFTTDPSTIWSVGKGLCQYGVTSYLPTIITSPLKTIASAQEVLLSGRPQNYQGATPLGLHIEGPFLNPEKRGSHNPQYLRKPSIEDYAHLSRDQGILLTTLAPELDGAFDVIKHLIQNGVVVSAGHSLATYDQAISAFDQGVRYGTHIFNAMPPYHQHRPGLAGALLTDPRPFVGLIPDGIHVHPTFVEMIWKMVGQDRLTLVTDTMAALGMPPGSYQIGDLKVIVDEQSSRLKDGGLAGSIISLDTALRNFIEMTGCTFQQALGTITHNPAILLGLDKKIGTIATGYTADITVLSPQLEVAMTICRGQITYQSESLLHRA